MKSEFSENKNIVNMILLWLEMVEKLCSQKSNVWSMCLSIVDFQCFRGVEIGEKGRAGVGGCGFTTVGNNRSWFYSPPVFQHPAGLNLVYWSKDGIRQERRCRGGGGGRGGAFKRWIN